MAIKVHKTETRRTFLTENGFSSFPVKTMLRDAGTGGQEGQPPPLPFTRRGKAKVLFQFKGLPWRNSELSEMLVQIFYEFASENARNAVIELQE